MLNILKTTADGLERVQDYETGAWIDLVSPTVEELAVVSKAPAIPLSFLQGPLDREEKSRIDIEEDLDLVHVIIDIPVVERMAGDQGYDTIPLGILLHPDFVVTTCLQPNPILGDFERGAVKSFATFKKTRFLLQVLQKVSSYYLRYLKRIDRETDKLERQLRASQKNEELFGLLTLEKALVYFSTSLRSNEVVLHKIVRTKEIRMYEEDQDLLEDVIVENKQAIEMAEIYSNILSGMMDAFASVISNNLNIVMKLLTSITIIVALPTMVASFYGMNVSLPFMHNSQAFVGVMVFSVVISALAALIFWRKRYL
ncbi:MAG: magnesium transporter CorA family protein [Actinobacteria bacterium]|nr:magnesium transporter CorA family protein [Actinomycetota bacterium]